MPVSGGPESLEGTDWAVSSVLDGSLIGSLLHAIVASIKATVESGETMA